MIFSISFSFLSLSEIISSRNNFRTNKTLNSDLKERDNLAKSGGEKYTYMVMKSLYKFIHGKWPYSKNISKGNQEPPNLNTKHLYSSQLRENSVNHI